PAQCLGGSEPAPVDLMAEAGLEVVGVVDDRAVARKTRKRRRRDRAVGDHAATVRPFGQSHGGVPELSGYATRERSGDAREASARVGEKTSRSTRGRDPVQLDARDLLEGSVGFRRVEVDI